MDNLNFGSGGALLGGTDALNQAVQRRAQGQGGQTDAVSPASASFDPNLQAPAGGGESPAPSQSPLGQSLGAPSPIDHGESTLIIKALDSRLKALSKMGQAGV